VCTDDDNQKTNKGTQTSTHTCIKQNQSKAAALRLLHRLGARLDEGTRLQRLVPYILSMLDDGSVYVRVSECLFTCIL
jgi:hypothetical protein